MSAPLDDLARGLAAPAPVGRRRMLGRMFAVLAGAGALTALDASGAQAAKPVRCPPGSTQCGQACRDTTSHQSHCGACGNACAADEICREGTCVAIPCTCPTPCPDGLTSCGGVCVDTSSSTAHCGGCGVACAEGEVCASGVCTPDPDSGCGFGQAMCGGVCIDVFTDRNNCGECGAQCDPESTCVNGVCLAQ